MYYLSFFHRSLLASERLTDCLQYKKFQRKDAGSKTRHLMPKGQTLTSRLTEGPSFSHCHPPRGTATQSTQPAEGRSSPEMTQQQTDGPLAPSPSPRLRRPGRGLLDWQESARLSKGGPTPHLATEPKESGQPAFQHPATQGEGKYICTPCSSL